MEQRKPLFYKGLPGFTRADEEVLARDAEETIYRWWWEYLRLSPAFWFARHTGHSLVDAKMAEAYELAGDLKINNFRHWWEETGIKVFAEAKHPAKVKMLDLENLSQHSFREKAIYLEVPLTMRKELILKKIREELDKVHDGRNLDVTKTANAPLKIHTKRYRLRVIKLEYWVLLYKLLYEDIAVWRVGDRLQIAPHLKLRGAELRLVKNKYNQLNSLTGRYLYKARYMLANAERKSFPNASKIIVPDGFMPFGEKYHRDYQAVIGEINGQDSAWKKWLYEEYAVTLKYHIARRNRVEDQIRLPGGKIRQRLPDFVAGKTDELN